MIAVRELATSLPAEVQAAAPYGEGAGEGLQALDQVTTAVAAQLPEDSKSLDALRAAIVIGCQGERVVKALRRLAPGIRQVLILDTDPRMVRTLVMRAVEGGTAKCWDDVFVEFLDRPGGESSPEAFLAMISFLRGNGLPMGQTLLYADPQEGAPSGKYEPLVAAATDLFYAMGTRFFSAYSFSNASHVKSLTAWANHLAATGSPAHALVVYYAIRHVDEVPAEIAPQVAKCWIQLACFEPIREWLPFLARDPAQEEELRSWIDTSLDGLRADEEARFAANMATLEEYHPQVHRKVAEHPPTPAVVTAWIEAPWSLIPHPFLDRPYPLVLDLSRGKIAAGTWLPDLRQCVSFATSVRRRDHWGVLFGTVRKFDVLMNSFVFVPEMNIPNWEEAVYVVERNVPLFRQLLRSIDLVPFFRADRIRWFLGEDAPLALASFVDANPERVLWDVLGSVEMYLVKTLKEIVARRTDEHQRAVDLVATTFAPESGYGEKVRDHFARRHERPLRVAYFSSYFTRVVRYCIADLAEAARALGMETLELIERSGVERLLPVAWSPKLVDFEPDMVVVIDRLRPQVGSIPVTVPTVSWIQDELPWLEDPAFIGQLGQWDLAYSIATPLMEGYRKKGYPRVELLHMGANPALYHPTEGLPPPTDEVALITNLAMPGEARQYPGLFAWILKKMEERGLGRTDRAYGEQLLADGARALGFEIAEEDHRRLLFTVRMDLEIHFDRAQTARTLIRAGVPVVLYGRGWGDLPEFRPYARGPVAQGHDLCEVYQRHKVVLHVNALLNMHQRVLECLASGGFVLPRTSPTDDLPGELAASLAIGSEVMTYSTAEELVETVRRAFADEPWRRGIAEAGRGRVLRDHTYKSRMKKMVEDLAGMVLRG